VDLLKVTVLLVGRFLPAGSFLPVVRDRPVRDRPVRDRPVMDRHQVMASPASILRSPVTARHIRERSHSNLQRRARVA
jgi:hypothetical protein